MEQSVLFGKADYIVMGLMLLISLAIGVFFAVSGRRKKTQIEYLLGGRNLGALPVCLSLFATFNSAVSLLGIPAEVYSYGTMAIYLCLSISLANLLCLWTLLPLVYPLKITSIYEYLQLRFESKEVRLLAAIIGMISNLSYMTIALLSPALALQTAAGLPLWMSLILVGIVGTVYTAIGGLRSVVWTDTFQTVIIFGGIIATLIKGCYEVGGFGNVWTIAGERGRLIFDDTSPDPRTRHTLWNLLIGSTTFWLGVNFGQSYSQRLCATRSMRDCKIVVSVVAPINLVYGIILIITGLTILVYFDVIGCDPLAAGYIKNANQLMPYFVIRTLGFIPGLSGLYISTIFSGALSTLSSGINSLAANSVEDLLKPCVRQYSEATRTAISKLLVCLYGCATVGLAYLVKEATGPVTQITYTALGASNGPVLGLFLLAGIFPQANKVGGFIGCIAGLVFGMWLSVCKMLYGSRTSPLPAGPLDSCEDLTNAIDRKNENGTFRYLTLQDNTFHNRSLQLTGGATPMSGKLMNISTEKDFSIYDISYTWIPFLGVVMVIITGLITSLAVELYTGNKKRPSGEYLFPFARRLWYKTNHQVDDDTEPVEMDLFIEKN